MRKLPWILIVSLVVMWLLLNISLSAGQIVMGIALSFCMVLGFRAIRPIQPHVRRPRAIVVLAGRVLIDVFRSNIGVARVVLGLTGGREVKSGFLKIPIVLKDPHGLAVLAAIVTSTPGTVWVDLTRDGGELTLHVLDLQDEQHWIQLIQQRYEAPLREIFE